MTPVKYKQFETVLLPMRKNCHWKPKNIHIHQRKPKNKHKCWLNYFLIELIYFPLMVSNTPFVCNDDKYLWTNLKPIITLHWIDVTKRQYSN